MMLHHICPRMPKRTCPGWINNVGSSFKNVVQPNPDVTLTTYPSTKGLKRGGGRSGQFMGNRKLVALGVWRSKGFTSTIWS